MAVPLHPHSNGDNLDARRQLAFSTVSLTSHPPHSTLSFPLLIHSPHSQLKSICVPLLSLTRLPPSPSTTTSLTHQLSQLLTSLSLVPSTVFTPALAHYIFFPISSLLQPTPNGSRGEVVLEKTMEVLAVLVEKWRRAGIEMRVLHELWIMCGLKLGGPLDVEGPKGLKGKGKAKAGEELSEETQLAVLRVLIALMAPLSPEPANLSPQEEVSDEDDYLGGNLDWTTSGDLPTQKPPPIPLEPPPILPPPPIPILFHTLTTLLEIASMPTSLLQLQLDALSALGILIQFYLIPHPPSSAPDSPPKQEPKGPSPLLATALPGTVSTLSRIALSTPRNTPDGTTAPEQARRQPSAAISAALGILQVLVGAAINDEVTKDLRERRDKGGEGLGGATLEEIVEASLSQSSAPSISDSLADSMQSSSTIPSNPENT
ncbi:TELO2-interacting protein 1, partial [Phenoliferia sp. Uapishka_3]